MSQGDDVPIQTSFKFGQRVPPLVHLLRDILERYPEGGQILKELIQNADDARATNVAFLLDARKNVYGVEKLVKDSLKDFQGPALYTQNNAVFMDDDWSSIQTPYCSMKKEDPLKVGKFGIGFNSIYHLTDLPSVVSGDKIGFFDPHRKHFGGETGQGFTMQEARNRAYADQFRPYNVLGCDMTQPRYEGTLFRFPLRQEPSELSPNVSTCERIRELFQSFQADAHLVLLFLKAVEAITIYEWLPGNSKPTEVFQVRLSDTTRMEVRAERGHLLRDVTSSGTKDCILAGVEVKRFYHAEITSLNHRESPVTQCWLVHNYISTKQKEVHSTAGYLAQVPWVGLAVPTGQITKQADGLGRIFCFLPLPPSEDADSNTGLPVHVHGSFSVADNRRSLKWPAEDRLKDEKAMWNQLLTEHLLPQAYAGLILHAIQLQCEGTSLTPEDVYRMWPDPQRVHYHWSRYLLPRFFHALSQHAVLWTEASGGKWVYIQEAIINEKSKQDLALFESVAAQEMLRIGRPVVFPPTGPIRSLGEISVMCGVESTPMSPEIVRTCLQESGRYEKLSRPNKVQLLMYVIQDHSYSSLHRLRLLPLSNGSFTSFQGNSSPVYISSLDCPQSLFPGLEGEFLDEKIDHDVFECLKSAAADGSTQLSRLYPVDVPALVHRVLPQQWIHSGVAFVASPLQIGDVSTDRWTTKLWQWIDKHHRDVSLSEFEGSYILPVTSTNGTKTLRKLTVDQPAIFTQLPGTSVRIGADLDKGLESIGCSVLVNAPGYLSSCHPLHGTYVCRPTEIVSCIAKVSTTSSTYKIFSQSQRKQLVSLLSAALQVNHPVSISEMKVLSHLPVIRQHGSNDLVSIAECPQVAPLDLPIDLPVGVRLLAFPSREEEAVMTHSSVKCRRLTVEDLFSEIIIPQFQRYSPKQREVLMVYLLENIRLLKANTRGRLSGLVFVKTGDVTLKAPRELFNPTERYADQLFAEKSVFPIGTFAVDTEHGKLMCEHVGLRKMADLSAVELLQIAKDVASGGKHIRAKALLEIIVKHRWAQQLLQKTPYYMYDHGTALSRVAWMPVIEKPLVDYPGDLQWAGSSSLCVPSSVVAAKEGLPTETLQLVLGSQLHVVDHVKPLPEDLVRLLCFATRESAYGAIVRHLRSVYEIWTKGLSLDKEKTKVERILREIFSLLGEGFRSCVEVRVAMKRELQNFGALDWVWLNKSHGFARPDQLAVSSACPVSLEPWFFELEKYPQLSDCMDLLKQYGLKDTIGEADALLVLEQMRSISSQNGVTKQQQEYNLNLAIAILNWVTSDRTVISDELRAMVLVPVHREDNKLELSPPSELMYCDAKWLAKGEDSELDDYRLIHKKISPRTAYKLGVPSLSSRLAPSEDLEFEFEQLGQHEPLTLRLKNILKDYKDDAGIFKEIIQNADDAGATKVRFLVDWRKHGTASLLSPGMKHCQGPALWAYNDSVFSDEDFQNIAKLAAATKRTKLNKIGRFGLGFTSIYHVTDVPSFVSRRFVVMFDPHTTHLGSHIRNPSKPGVKIDFIEKPVAKRFPDQFRPYGGVFGCNLVDNGEFEGTLFRFPFRTREQATRSEIKNEPYDERRVRTSIDAFKLTCSKLLLFLNNVQSVELFELPSKAKNVTEMKLLMSVQSETATLPNAKSHADILSQCCEQVHHGRPLSLADSRDSAAVSRISFSASQGKKMQRVEETWLSCARTGDSEVYACSADVKDLGLVPFAGVAVKLDCRDKKWSSPNELLGLPSAVEGEAFCFLPLSERTGLPFHINGFFSVNSNRRGIWWFGTEETSVTGNKDRDAVWNQKIIDDPLVKSCIGLLRLFADILNTSDPNAVSEYYKLWPSLFGSVGASWKHVVEQFYSAVAKCKETLVCTSGTRLVWISIGDCVMLQKNVVRRYRAACKVMVECCDTYVKFPDHVVEGLRAADDSLVDEISVDEVRFVEEFFAPNVTSLQTAIRDEITHALLKRSLNEDRLATSIRNMDIIPCSPDGLQFCKPSELVDPRCPEARLYLPEERKFPADGSYRSNDLLLAMKRLGMRSSGSFNWNDVVERAETVEELENTNHDRAVQRIMALIDLMHSLTESTGLPSDDQTKIQIRKLRFLPIADCPKGYPLPVWHGRTISEVTIACPEDVYDFSCRNTVGSQALILHSSLQLSVQVTDLLGVKVQPDIALLLKHLNVAVNAWRESSSRSKSLSLLIDEVYRELEERIIDRDSRDFVVGSLKDKGWIKNGSHVVKSQQVAFDWDKEAPPYLLRVSDDLKRTIEQLLIAVGVRDKFCCDDFVWALKQLYNDTADDGHRLVNRRMRTARSLLEELQFADKRELEKYEGTIPVLSEVKTLVPASDLAYNDAPWIVLPDEQSHTFVHKYISRSLAEHLGVKLVRNKVLEQYAEDWPGLPFGQHEPLVQRLKNVLEGYPVGDSILKELLQNADDARASEIHFVYDKRNHGTERVLSQTWSDLQGEALCVYNNRPFTQEDIVGIQNLGRGSKRDDPALTGQYGIGFNAVYHLTDCPSFITNNERLCVMDPHCRYVDGAIVERPGRLFRTDKSFWDRCPDVRPCYCEIPGITLEGGTLFRFPLRTQAMASTSKISNSVMEGLRMESLFEEFKEGAADMLLFLNYVSSIRLSVLEEDGSFSSSFSVSSAMSEEAREKRELLSDYIARNKRTPTGSIDYRDVSYELIVTKEEGNPAAAIPEQSQKWLVHQSFGLSTRYKETDYPDVSRLSLLPRAGIAAPLRSDCLTGNWSKAFCFLPLPVATHLPVHVNGHFALNDSRRNLWRDLSQYRTNEKQQWNEDMIKYVVAPAYTKLLLDARDYVEVDATSTSEAGEEPRRQLEARLVWFHGLFPQLIQSRDHYWNMLAREVYRFIAEDCLPLMAFIDQPLPSELQSVERNLRRGKQKRSQQIAECTGWFGKTPTVRWLPVATEHRTVSGLYFTYFWNMDETCSLFIPSSTSSNSNGEILAYTLKCLLLAMGFPVVVSPWFMKEAFDLVDRVNAAATLSPKAVELFLRHYLDSQLGCKVELGDVRTSVLTSAAHASIVLKYLLTENGVDVTQLNDIPMLVTQNGQLKQFSVHAPVYVSRYSSLLPQNGDLFLCEESVSVVGCCLNVNEAKVFKELTPQCLADLLPASGVFPTSMQPGDTSYWQWNDEGCPSVDWIKTLWRYLRSQEGSDQDCLNHLSRWPVIPLSHRQHLVPPHLGYSVFCFQFTFSPYGDVKAILKHMDVPELNVELTCGVHPTELHPRLKPVVADLLRPESVVRALRYLYQNRPPTTLMTVDDAESLLKYFQASVRSTNGTNRVISFGHLVKHLPLFETLHGTLAEVASCYECHALPAVPANGAKVWMGRADHVTFLKEKPILGDLYDALGLGNLTLSKLYADFILDSLPEMVVEDRVTHLLFIRENCESWRGANDKTDNVLIKLRKIKCLPRLGGDSDKEVLYPVSSFFDWEIDVFRLMLEAARFPPESLREKEWHAFFLKLGLQTKASRDQLIQFAHKLERESNSCLRKERKQFQEKSKAVVEHLFSHYHNDRQLLCQIAKIPFIPVRRCDQRLSTLAIPRADRVLPTGWVLNFSDIVRYSRDNEMLCWTTAGLLPSWAIPHHPLPHPICNHIETALQIKGEPLVPDVVNNLVNLIRSRHHVAENLISTLVDVLEVIFKHLQENCRANSRIPARKLVFKDLRRLSDLCIVDSSDARLIVEKLHDYPCIFVETKKVFVKPSQVVSNLTDENSSLAPYLCRLPTYLARCGDILKRLGVEDQPQAFHYARVLEQLRDDSTTKEGQQRILLPHEYDVALRGTKLLFGQLKTMCLETGSLRPTKQQRHSEEELRMCLSPLFLLSRDGTLKASGELIFLDRPEYERCVQSFGKPFLVSLRACGLIPLPRETVNLLPQGLRPHLFSELARETLVTEIEADGGGLVELKDVENYAHQLQCLLASNAFVSGLYSAIVHYQQTSSFSDEAARGLTSLTNVEIECLPTVVTCLVLTDPPDKVVADSERSVTCFLTERDDVDRSVKLYVSYSDGHRTIEMVSHLSTILRRLLAIDLPGETVVSLLGCYNPSEIKQCLACRGITFVDCPSCLTSGLALPSDVFRLGSTVDKQYDDDGLIVKDLAYSFQPGDWVAYEISEDHLVYALVEGEVTDEDTPQLEKRYRIDIGREALVVVSAMDLYKFDRRLHERSPSAPSMALETVDCSEDLTVDPNSSVEEKHRFVRQQLDDVWSIRDQEARRKAIRRLYLRWHPDTSSDPDATVVFQFLRKEVARRESKEPNSSFSGYHPASFSSFYSSWDSTVASAAGRRRHRRPWHSSSFTGRFGQRCDPTPDPHLGRKFVRQASADYDAALYLMTAEQPQFYATVCFLSQQVSEKALKGAWYVKAGLSGSRHSSHCIRDFVGLQQLSGCPPGLEDDARRVSGLVDHETTRYPTSFSDPPAVSAVYSRERATSCLSASRGLLDKVQEFIRL